ncbi:hypothetical protein DFP92_109149 [Yoonia sediminilitoris]|uniref:Asparagine synthase (Glutamine-hydrolysing) n=1 Tax=Yoonia sediminilitoris TaxID=1286148 RepID=A0A2T6KD59_9RHOB|nr:hypothetical protein C8N45_109149 [Yoonia sediminilitoris]RCW94317.1 hypothetical protein DFP92_109149 [Yoonia sediminilitoris]
MAETLCSDRNVSFAQTFRYQYIVSPDKLDLPGFTSVQCGSQWVASGAALRRVMLTDCAGNSFGVCLGVAVDHDGNLPEEALQQGFDSRSPEARDALEECLARLSGRYALIVELGGITYFYCDPVGMIGAVYAPETRRIAASTFLCIDRPVEWNPLYDRAEIEVGEGSYGLSHTCDAHVFRLNANHRMALDKFETTRFWPKPTDKFTAETNDYDAIFDEMIDAGRKIMTRMTSLGPTSLPLSGGNDSRILMSLATAPCLQDVTQIFSHINTYANRRDAHVAASLCAAKGVPFEVHDRKILSAPRYVRRLAARRYQVASGALAAVPKEIDNGLFLHVKEDSIVMRGHQTNIMRGQYLVTANPEEWRKPRWQIRMMSLVGNGKFNAEVAQRFHADFKKHYDDLPANALERSADFIFFETLVPAALGVLFPGQDHAFYLSPFNSRRLVQLSMQPDTEYRLTNAPTTDFLLRADHELAVLPFAYELPADLNETPEAFEKRKQRVAQGLARFEGLFGQPAPIDVNEIAPLATSTEA